MAIGQRIQNRREELGLTQEELAHRIGYKSKSSINKIELGVYSLRQSKIKAIADALETTPAYIMGWDERPEPAREDLVLNAEERELVVRYRGASEDTKNAVAAVLGVKRAESSDVAAV